MLIDAPVLDAMVAHARGAAPLECCGLLVGTPGHIDESVPTANVDPNPARFQVDPAAHIDLNRKLRGSDRAVVGVYHSHPATGAEPSPSDLAEAHYSEFVYVIVSLADRSSPSIRAYRIVSGRASPIVLGASHGGGT